jgi:hypothetical protein
MKEKRLNIDYILTEKCKDASMTADKRRIRDHIQTLFPLTTSEKIIIQSKNKECEIPYLITCTSTTENCSNDYVYSIHLECESSNNLNSARILGKAHLEIYNHFARENEFRLIVANDGLSEYYCNKAYPKFQKLERLLRNLIFVVVAKAYGDKWVDKTMPKELKPKINKNQLIESALTEMTLGVLIEYLFYGQTEVAFADYIDENYPANKLQEITKDNLVLLIEKGRRKSVWNKFIAENINLLQPKEKLEFLRDNRNKIAHCKPFYAADYNESMKYLDLLIPQIDKCINKVSIKDSTSAREIILGFGNFTQVLSECAKQIGQAIAPAITQMAELAQSVVKVMQESIGLIPVNPSYEMFKELVEYTSAIRNPVNLSERSEIAQSTSRLPNIPTMPLLLQVEQQVSNDDSVEKSPETEPDEESEDKGSNK